MPKSKSKFYVTTSIAYANADPHIGYAMELVQADALARYHRARGDEVFFATGTDEHGTKIFRAATEAGQKPQAFVDAISTRFESLTEKLGISHDAFIRTSSAEHQKRARTFWEACSPDIYKHQYDGLYCVGCEAYYTEKEAEGGKCPIHGIPLEKLSEENYFFKLSKYTEAIKEAIESDKLRVVPETRKNEILALITSGLEDVSISRDIKRLPWGVPVPGDDSQVMYVWFDALPNYLTVLGYPDGPNVKAFWPADVHVIGKDILRQHAALWPGMLLSAGMPLPVAIYVHGFIESGGVKMSKSLGNVIDPFEQIERFGADALRFYLLSEIASYGDGDYTTERMQAAYDERLANDLGNLVQRTIVMINKFADGVIPAGASTLGRDEYDTAMSEFRFDRALELIFKQVQGLNQFIDERKPWVLAKESKASELTATLAQLAADIKAIGELLAPFLPEAADAIARAFVGPKVPPEPQILFPKLS